MIINGKDIDVDSLINLDNLDRKFLKDVGNGLLLSEEQIEILKRYDIDYNKCVSVNELLYVIDDCLESTDDPELELVASTLAERNYYTNTNK